MDLLQDICLLLLYTFEVIQDKDDTVTASRNLKVLTAKCNTLRGILGQKKDIRIRLRKSD